MSDTEVTHNVSKPSETIHQLKARQEKELKELKKTAKGKAFKDQEKAVEVAHASAMAALQAQWTAFRLAEAGEAAPAPGAAALAESGAAAAAVGGGMYADRSGEISKQKKKALAREAREAEAERALAAEAAALPDKRALEFAALAAKLAAQVAFEGSFAGCAPRIKEVRADGHCMFRAIADQLALHAADDDGDASAATRLRDAAALRTAAVEHMRAHRDDFAPFLISADGDPVEDADAYFAAMANTGAAGGDVQWGGQPELSALAAVLGRDIVVHQAQGAAITVPGDGPAERAKLHLALHQHACALGAHYNSVVPDINSA